MRRAAVGALVFLASFAVTAPVQANTIAYPLSEIQQAFLSHDDFGALADWGTIKPDASTTPECRDSGSGGYMCSRSYIDLSDGWYARPRVFTVESLSDATQATAVFARQRGLAMANASEVLSDSARDFGVQSQLPNGMLVVTSGRLDRNHYIEISCWASRSPVTDVNTCTQMILNAQTARLADLVSPRVAVPEAPSDVLIDAKKGNVTVTWLPPESDGGAPILDFTATSTTGDLKCSSAATSGTVQTCTVSGAQLGESYVFTVTARNEAGVGQVSAPSSPVGFTTKPGKPRAMKAAARGTDASINWKAPRETGGLKISRYIVRDNVGATVCSTVQRSCLVSGLAFGTRYRFTIQAINARGAGPRQSSRWIRTSPAPVSTPVNSPDPGPDPKPEQSLS